ncbi:MAG TPA: acetyl-CoA carboxylase biotin carboxyl carrier protein [Bacillus bacterium]|uniref:Biotin carboxyl carrier protein of acetyl-CoA carboxylase n=1 Tax=Siminovitchia fordii TaxID=254759 RepID=A0ABQ4K4S6_9BACI|nr:acetyl-CoA carboxylase biotin carboxyl carrier protein [Siminovitchia fordii]GIN19956.1 acetyl-CoA carboxylase, biotin carboxyl carrier protein [Siminovitchia fordii]HBZ08977.1 acetyl-CoA carboxylase biotin carboxyl carrier protein [Bacillus sp. (in: firmicutes)]
MLKVQEIREIIKLIDQSDIEEFVYEHDGSKIELKKRVQAVVQEQVRYVTEQIQSPQPVVRQETAPEAPAVEKAPATPENTSAQAAEKSNLHKIVSPMVGTFYQASSPDSDPYVKVGSEVTSDSIVCIVEAMKLFNEIEAEVEGKIAEILVKDGELVEYGQPLFLVEPK